MTAAHNSKRRRRRPQSRQPGNSAETGEYTQPKFVKVLAVEGLRNVFDPRKHPLERVLWVFLIGFAVYGAFSVGRYQWVRFQASPTVIQLDKNYREWVGTMPAATVCFRNRFDPARVLEYIVSNNLSPTNNKTLINDLLELVATLVSMTAPDFSALNRFANQSLLPSSVNILQLISAAHPAYDTEVNSFDPEYNGLPIKQIITERGICYALNAPLASMLQGTNFTDVARKISHQKSVTCAYTKHQCYMKIDTYESTISFIIHSPRELPTSDTPLTVMGASDEVVESYQVQETVASNRLRDLTVKQRNCVFNDENHRGFEFYSYNLCVMRCRAAKALELCHCRPHFYPFVEGPTCTIAGLLCLSKQSVGWYDEKLSCGCLKPCTEIVYVLVGTTQNQWRAEGGIPFKQRTSLRWEILQPKTRMLRDVLFSFEDLLVSFGGGFALFIGKNMFTLAEVLEFVLQTAVGKILKLF